ncbi:hypothetical protein ACFL96_01995 [Thermoproteota archaeon]
MFKRVAVVTPEDKLQFQIFDRLLNLSQEHRNEGYSEERIDDVTGAGLYVQRQMGVLINQCFEFGGAYFDIIVDYFSSRWSMFQERYNYADIDEFFDEFFKNVINQARSAEQMIMAVNAYKNLGKAFTNTQGVSGLVLQKMSFDKKSMRLVLDYFSQEQEFFYLSFSGCDITEEALGEINRCLVAANCCLKKLEFTDCGIGDRGLHALLTNVSSNQSLEVLILNVCHLSDQLDPLCGWLSLQDCPLQELGLIDKGIGTTGAQNVFCSLATNLNLRELTMQHCAISEIEPCEYQHSELRALRLAFNAFGNAAAGYSRGRSQSRLQKLVQQLRCFPNLDALDLSGNDLSDAGLAEFLSGYLIEHKFPYHFMMLNLSFNPIQLAAGLSPGSRQAFPSHLESCVEILSKVKANTGSRTTSGGTEQAQTTVSFKRNEQMTSKSALDFLVRQAENQGTLRIDLPDFKEIKLSLEDEFSIPDSFKMFQYFKSLSKLIINGRAITLSQAGNLVRVLNENNRVCCFLDLSNNAMGTEGIDTFCTALRDSRINDLFLSGNPLSLADRVQIVGSYYFKSSEIDIVDIYFGDFGSLEGGIGVFLESLQAYLGDAQNEHLDSCNSQGLTLHFYKDLQGQAEIGIDRITIKFDQTRDPETTRVVPRMRRGSQTVSPGRSPGSTKLTIKSSPESSARSPGLGTNGVSSPPRPSRLRTAFSRRRSPSSE